MTTTRTPGALKPCPFCGDTNISLFDKKGTVAAKCYNCGARSTARSIYLADAKDNVRAAWNRRTPTPGAGDGAGMGAAREMACYFAGNCVAPSHSAFCDDLTERIEARDAAHAAELTKLRDRHAAETGALREAVSQYAAAARRDAIEECAKVADVRLEHWQQNYRDNVAAKCEFPQYNMGARAEAATVGERIRALAAAQLLKGQKEGT